MKRRQFLKKAAGIAAGSVMFPYVVPSSAVGAGAVSPSNRITVGHIGIGSQGGLHLRDSLSRDEVKVLGVCDVDGQRRQSALDLSLIHI